MKILFRAAPIALLLFALQTLAISQVVIAASSSSPATPSALTKNSYVTATLAPGLNTVVVDIAASYTGTFALLVAYQGAALPLRTWPAASISNCLASGTGLTANTDGTWTTTIPGPGFVYLTATALSAGTPSVFLGAGAPASGLSFASMPASAPTAPRLASRRMALVCHVDRRRKPRAK